MQLKSNIKRQQKSLLLCKDYNIWLYKQHLHPRGWNKEPEQKKTKKPLIKKGNRDSFERIYYYEGKHYVATGIGTNGFIVLVYPKKTKGDK